MKQIKILFTVLIFALAACRSVPRDVRTAHDLSISESSAAFVIAEDTLNKIEIKSQALNQDSVRDAFTEWNNHLDIVVEARRIVEAYLRSGSDPELINSYVVASQLLSDMDRGFLVIDAAWESMLALENTAKAAEFVALFRKDIQRYRTLERKFDEWIKQFKVRG